jgi:hypothetical protein
MLPGLRFLFVAIVLSMSMLIFGLGAAALLRSAHEEFASLPNKRAQPEPVFAQPVETTRPTLALLRVDALPEQISPDRPAAPSAATLPEPPSLSAAEPAKAVDSDKTVAEPDKVVAALPSEEGVKSSDQASETSAPADTTARADIVVAPLETQAAAAPQPAAPAAAETTATVSQPLSAPADAGATAAAMKIATLGGPAVVIDPKAASKTPLVTSGKRAQTRPRIKRRRIVRPQIVPPKPVTLGFFDPLPVPDRPTRQN